MLRVRTVFTGATGTPWLSTFMFGGSGTQTNADNAVLETGIFWGFVDANIDNQISWSTEADVDQVNVDGSLEAVFTTTPQTGTGGSTGNKLPFASQAMIRWRTSTFVNGRELRGRTYIPGLTDTALSEGELNSTVRNNLISAGLTLINSTVADLVVWSRTFATSGIVVGREVPTKFMVQRSRRD
jgi:hypothetical protein